MMMRRKSARAIVVSCSALILTACATQPPLATMASSDTIAVSSPTTSPTMTEAEREAQTQRRNAARLSQLVDEVEEEHEGVAGIAIHSAEGEVAVGKTDAWRAWSTIKVPVAIAALQNNENVGYLVEPTISASENDTAAALWASMGTSREAAAKVGQLLWRNEGYINVREEVDSYGTRHTPIGLIEWSLPAQASFATKLPCVEEAEPVYEAMGNIVEWQQDGLGRIEGVHFKGGWSDEHSDSEYLYTYRQFGVLPSDDGVIGMAIIAHPDDGSHETSVEMLDDLAAGIAELIDASVFTPLDDCIPDTD